MHKKYCENYITVNAHEILAYSYGSQNDFFRSFARGRTLSLAIHQFFLYQRCRQFMRTSTTGILLKLILLTVDIMRDQPENANNNNNNK